MELDLSGWANFYVIVGSSAGALIGLQFVVIALVSTTRTQTVAAAVRAFGSPTVVYFASVLVTAGLLNIPYHSRPSLGGVLIALGAIGLAYISRVGYHMRRQDTYVPDRGDWFWFVYLPATAYSGALAAGVTVWASPRVSLDVIGASVMLLLLVGVHNAWDSAVYMVANPSARTEERS